MGDASSNEISVSLPGASADSPRAAERKKRHPLRNRAFRLLWIGNTISWTGDQFYLVALPWLVLSLTGSSIVLGAIEMLGNACRDSPGRAHARGRSGERPRFSEADPHAHCIRPSAACGGGGGAVVPA